MRMWNTIYASLPLWRITRLSQSQAARSLVGAGKTSSICDGSRAAFYMGFALREETCLRYRCPQPRMARDLIGPALPPGFKALGTAEDKERDPSPGEPPRVPCSPSPPAPPLARPCSLSEGLRPGRAEEWGAAAAALGNLPSPAVTVGRRPWAGGFRNEF